MSSPSETEIRRPLKTRQQAWPRKLARYCVDRGYSPNQVSMASVGFAAVGAVAFCGASSASPILRAIFLFAAAICIQLRLLANMLDGLMAVEEGKQTPTGPLYNELPDRAADALFLVAAGYAAHFPVLGWLAALLAVSTAYVRALGGSLGKGQDFSGPMAKPHRMFTLTVGCILAAFLPYCSILSITLAVIILGSVITLWRRAAHLAAKLHAHPDD